MLIVVVIVIFMMFLWCFCCCFCCCLWYFCVGSTVLQMRLLKGKQLIKLLLGLAPPWEWLGIEPHPTLNFGLKSWREERIRWQWIWSLSGCGARSCDQGWTRCPNCISQYIYSVWSPFWISFNSSLFFLINNSGTFYIWTCNQNVCIPT